MGTDFALACRDCFEFIDLHKWSIIKGIGQNLVDAHSNQLIFSVTAQQLTDSLVNFPPQQPYIKKILPFVRTFIASHQDCSLFMTCDTGDYPWDIGEPQWYEWREIQAVFNYHGQFLPKNLVRDFGFRHWAEVLEYYAKNESWFLHEQMTNERELLRKAFETVANN